MIKGVVIWRDFVHLVNTCRHGIAKRESPRCVPCGICAAIRYSAGTLPRFIAVSPALRTGLQTFDCAAVAVLLSSSNGILSRFLTAERSNVNNQGFQPVDRLTLRQKRSEEAPQCNTEPARSASPRPRICE